MPSANKLFNYIFYLWHKHDVTVFFSRIAHLPIAHVTTELLRCTTPDFIVPDMWPPNSPDLNSVDYAIWSVKRQYETRVHDIDELWQRLLHVWCSLEQSLIDDAVDQCPTPLHGCFHARGRYFEHTLWLSICFLCTWWTCVSNHAWCSRSCSKGPLQKYKMWRFIFTR